MPVPIQVARQHRSSDPMMSKVPQITILFWVIKILSTGMGESASDWALRRGQGLPVIGIAGTLGLDALIGIGSLGSLLVLYRLGKSFSIMPEARKLVTGGPYAYARHPLYTVEMVTIVGTALQFAAPWSWLIALVVVTLLWIRSHFEEQVLAEAYPEYAVYRTKTKRFIPGVI